MNRKKRILALIISSPFWAIPACYLACIWIVCYGVGLAQYAVTGDWET